MQAGRQKHGNKTFAAGNGRCQGGKMENGTSERERKYWSRTRALTIVVLILWFIFAFVMPWYAAELNAYEFLGFPLGYYMVVQGSLIAFVLLIFIQNWVQDRIDSASGYSEE
jgi:putative solute:sodium symporter small subunit